MGDVDVRAFAGTDADYEGWVALKRLCWPHSPLTVESQRDWDDRWDDGMVRHRFVATDPDHPDSIVGVAQLNHLLWDDDRRKLGLSVFVHPSHEGSGVRDRLFAAVSMDLARLEAISLETSVHESETAAISWYEAHGFSRYMTEKYSRLDTATFDAAAFADIVDRVEASGIRLCDVGTLLGERPDGLRDVYDLTDTLMADVPPTGQMSNPPYERWRRMFIDTTELVPDAYLIALDGDTMVGMSEISADLATDELYRTGLTGTIEEYRRRGIATAMKVRAIEHIKSRTTASGVAPTIETGNAIENPMYQLNLRLGFVPQPAMLIYRNDNPLRT